MTDFFKIILGYVISTIMIVGIAYPHGIVPITNIVWGFSWFVIIVGIITGVSVMDELKTGYKEERTFAKTLRKGTARRERFPLLHTVGDVFSAGIVISLVSTGWFFTSFFYTFNAFLIRGASNNVEKFYERFGEKEE